MPGCLQRSELPLRFREQLAKVTIGSTAMVLARTLLSAVIAVHYFLARFTSGDAAGDLQRMSQLNRLVGTEPIPATIHAQQFAYGVAELVCLPLWMIRAAFIWIANGHTLYGV